ncbi:hypothetical protein GT204_16485 [Streptomyces sp. SID4919]|uniref:hypothetical protein n=1 Tax=unclassified Streptomyces TaxID=2593676 RepID=UPI000823B2F2|nr:MULTISPECIES: hypothetical protein [unclassified Streptomyces]MYY10460.1 hypothetical protein [Streptomyces sp. SID4919]SCK46639.1 hypothetical protein YW7DRAFT_04134 [Streptomyces sp. AmelKG-E11A]
MIVTVAVALLPLLGGLLAMMAWWEDRLFRASDKTARSPVHGRPGVVGGGDGDRPGRSRRSRRSHTRARRRHAAGRRMTLV